MSATIQFNGLTLGNSYAYTVNLGQGLTGLTNRVSESNLLGRDGGRVFNRKDSMRTIVLSGRINGPTVSDFFTNVENLMAAFNNKASDTFVYTDWNGTTRQVTAKVVQEPLVDYQGGQTTTARFQVILRVEDPYWLETTAQTLTLFLEEVQGFDFPFDFPFDILGGTGTSQGIINNTGDVELFPKVTFTAQAPLINPTLTNLTTGKSLQIENTMTSGDVVVIEYGSAGVTVTLNNSTNWFQFLNGDLFKLAVGNNTLGFTATSFDAASTCVIEYFVGYR